MRSTCPAWKYRQSIMYLLCIHFPALHPHNMIAAFVLQLNLIDVAVQKPTGPFDINQTCEIKSSTTNTTQDIDANKNLKSTHPLSIFYL